MTASDGRGVAPLDLALEVADELGLPVMCHLDNPPPSRPEVVGRLRAGDIMTHCFRPFPGAPARARDGAVREEILRARDRGVLFDIGHGAGSFGFVTAEAMLAAGFLPDCISSDVHVLSIDGPAYDELVTLSKFLALGMALPDVIAAATAHPARAIGKPELASLAPGTTGDATVMRLAEGRFEFEDVNGLRRTGSRRLERAGMVLDGRWWEPAS
jgi:dihydroorotase